jgi:predicted Zn-dependent protease with MMP-like domain
MGFRVSREHFEKLVEKAIGTLPDEYREHFTNIAVVVKDYPDKEDEKRSGAGDGLLLGLFDGVPYHGKGGFFEIFPSFPGRITLFQTNIEEFCSNEEELIEEIQTTIVHEVGHYFGLSEEDLDEYEDEG